MTMWRSYVNAIRLTRFLSLLAILSITAICFARQPDGTLPTVISAKVPTYPDVARKLGIEGLVHLRVSTDGSQVTEIKVKDGPAMLAAAAEENLRTWQFQEHQPTSFDTVFKYELLPYENDCSAEILPDDGKTVLRLPKEVELTARGLRSCVPVLDLTKPAILDIQVQLNEKPVSPPKQVTVTVGDRSLELPSENGRFKVPTEVLQSKIVQFSTVIGEDRIRIGGIYGGKFAEGSWLLMLADKNFPQEFGTANEQKDVWSTCVLVFEFGEHTALTAPQCRSKIKEKE
jgi:hypothetical protein